MMYRPQFLCPGDSVSIVSPASIINPDYVKGATGVLESWSLGVTVSSHQKSNILNRFFSLSGSFGPLFGDDR